MLRTHRKCGLATKLMQSSHRRMQESFDAEYAALHVRRSNHAAFHLYSQTLAYTINDIEKGYYADGEDAYDMRKYFKETPKDGGKADNAKPTLADGAPAPEKAPPTIAGIPAAPPAEAVGDGAAAAGGASAEKVDPG